MITGNIYVVGAYYTCSERLTKTECVCFLQLLDSGKLCPFFIAYMMGFNWSFLNKNNKTEEQSDKISQHALWTSRAFHHCGNPVSPTLRRFLQQVFVMCNCKCDYHCGRYGRLTRSTSHMHMVPLQSPTGKIAVVPLQDKCDVCVSASVHEDLHLVSVLPSRIKKVRHHA